MNNILKDFVRLKISKLGAQPGVELGASRHTTKTIEPH